MEKRTYVLSQSEFHRADTSLNPGGLISMRPGVQPFNSEMALQQVDWSVAGLPITRIMAHSPCGADAKRFNERQESLHSRGPSVCRGAFVARPTRATSALPLFWGHKPRVPGRVDLSCLSNWFPAPFVVAGHRYPTTEHYMMAEKARLFGDEFIRNEVLNSRSPGKAKALGRKVSDFREELWRQHRFQIVVDGNYEKFKQSEDLGTFLRCTGNKVLVEASPRDRIWGIGLSKDDRNARDPRSWQGLNLLGFALMEVRALLTHQHE